MLTAGAAVRIHGLTVANQGHPAVYHRSGAFVAGTLAAMVGPNGGFEGRIEHDPPLRMAYLPQAPTLERSFPVRVYEVVAMGLMILSAATARFWAAGLPAMAALSVAIRATSTLSADLHETDPSRNVQYNARCVPEAQLLLWA